MVYVKKVTPVIEANVQDNQGHHLGITQELALMVDKTSPPGKR